jgi:hypothetical protein
MVFYIEYILLIIIVVLLFILFNVKEGFNHKGDGFIADTSNPNKPDKPRGNRRANKRKNEIIYAAQESYEIAAVTSKFLIGMPYNIMAQILQMTADIIGPMLSAIGEIAESILEVIRDGMIKPIVKMVKTMFKKWLYVMKNIPEYIKKSGKIAVDLTKKISTFFLNIFKILFKIPTNGLTWALDLQDKIMSSMDTAS